MILLDTHAIVWWVSNDRRLSAPASRAIRAALRVGPVLTSAISVMEIAMAARRGRLVLAVDTGQWLADLRSLPELQFVPVTADIAAAAGSFDSEMPGDPADRIIVATAQLHRARLVTADERLRELRGLATVW